MRPINVLSGMQKIGRLLAGCLLIATAVVSCSGGTDGGTAGDESWLGTSFVASDGTTGTITLEVLETDLGVSEMTGFRVYVKDSAGRPVPEIRVFCDTEQGLAIIEPTSGSELTDDNGQMSGKVGCEVPGSLQIGCRLPIGAAFREFETIHCGGSIPAGFSGFGDTAGGGLGGPGGGVAVNDDGGIGGTDSENGVDIVSVATLDSGSDAEGTAIDIQAGCCGDSCGPYPACGADCTAEPFYDTQVKLTVANDSNQDVQFTTMRYRMENPTGVPSATETSDSIAIGDGIAAANDSKVISLMFLDAQSGGKAIIGGSAVSSGFKRVTFFLSGTNDLGEEIEVSASVTLSFDNYCNCSSGACSS